MKHLLRTDIDAYQQSLKKARNVFVLNQGPVERRQGTVFRYDLGEETRLEHFIFSENQEYLIAFKIQNLKSFLQMVHCYKVLQVVLGHKYIVRTYLYTTS